MNGGKVVLDRSKLKNNLVKKLEIFIIENSLKVEKVNFKTMVNNISLGEGRLIIFESSKLLEGSANDRIIFWSQLIKTFSLLHLKLESREDLEYIWSTRNANSQDLKYDEIRRLSIYNFTKKSKRGRLVLGNNFVLTKVCEQNNTVVKSSIQNIEVELSPNGHTLLDFGVFA